jgi:hypothetical protein
MQVSRISTSQKRQGQVLTLLGKTVYDVKL